MIRQVIILVLCTALVTAFLTLGAHHLMYHRKDDVLLKEWKSQRVNQSQLEKLIKSDRLHSNLLSSVPTDFITAAKVGTPAVVFIESIQEDGDRMSITNKGLATGSGVIISPDGYIVTNNHVVEHAEKIQVLLNDNREYEATVIGTDPTTDIALIKIEDSGLPYLLFGNSDSTAIGEWVLAVGNPFKLQSTVTAGIVSAKARNINILNNQQYRIESFIQTDAAVNPGNSGGALVNTAGELIGINTAIMTYTGRYEGYSFSIPSNLVRKVIGDLQEFGVVQRGLLGVTIENVDNAKAKQYGLDRVAGIFISNTTKSGAAEEAGLRPEDIILEVNGYKVATVSELQEIIGRFRPGAEVSLSFWRNKAMFTAKAILKNQINSTELIATRRDPVLVKLGFEVRDLSEAEIGELKTDGVKVLNIYRDGIIFGTNMAPSYIITTVNGKKIQSVDDLVDLINSASDKVSFDGFYQNYKGRYPYSFYKE
ncbi:MAG: trypsin-like peptidase domain-containing protein [Saprospiraceae bacterium]|nr:trypsin-like peptidase domain-containing protein [Candidatus Vicinibacter affinis]